MKASKEKLVGFVELFNHINNFDLLNTTELADTIVYYQFDKPCYFNLATNKISDCFLDVIRAGKKYIFVDWHDEKRHSGYIVKYFPEHNSIGAAMYTLVCKELHFEWQQLYRIVMYRGDSSSDYFYFDNDGKMIYSDAYKLRGTELAVDLCGQFVHPDKRDIKKDEIPFGFNIPKTSGEELRRFTKGVCFTYDQPALFTPENGLYDLGKAIDDDKISYGIKEICMENVDVDRLHLPENIIEMLSESAKSCFYGSSKLEYHMIAYNMKGVCAAYLQNINGDYIYRTFFAVVKGAIDDNGKMPIDIIETGRINLTVMGRDILFLMHFLNYPLIYFDREGIDNGIFKYCKSHIKKEELLVHTQLMCEQNKWGLIYNGDKAGLRTACCIAFIPIFEKLYRLFESKLKTDPNARCGIKKLMSIAAYCDNSMYKRLKLFLGNIDYDEKELHKALGIPKSLLNMLGYKGETRFEEIRQIKLLLANHTDFLMNMNKEMAENLISVIGESKHLLSDDVHVELLLKMICSFGPQDISSYIKLVSKEYIDRQRAKDYMNYIDKLNVVRQAVPDLKHDVWKVRGAELDKADEAINESYIALNDKKFYAESLLKFKEQYKEWKNYEYKNSSFIITYPKGPSELIEEGTKLRHCVKDYINVVASGETMVLFIRKKCSPKKPFYTLEVKNGKAIQCHGFGNCKAEECEGLMDFIKSFCDDKEITLEGKLDDLIGVGL